MSDEYDGGGVFGVELARWAEKKDQEKIRKSVKKEWNCYLVKFNQQIYRG